MSAQLDIQDPKVEIVLEKTGRILRVEEYEFRSDFLASCDSFSFTYYTDDVELRRGLEMQPVTLRINDRPQIVGRIEKTTRGNKGSAIRCEGRDYISDLVESNIDPKAIIKNGMKLVDAVLMLCSPCGISQIEAPAARLAARTGMVSKATTLHKLVGSDAKDLRPQAGRGIYEACNEVLARHGLMLQPSTKRGSVVIQPPTYDGATIGRILRVDGNTKSNIVLDGEATRDYSSFPTYTMFTGKQGTPEESGGVKGLISKRNLADFLTDYPEEIRSILRGTIVTDKREHGDTSAISGGALYRLLYFRDDKVGRTQAELDNAMMRAISERLRETLRYTCTVRGHANDATGYTWANDCMVDVDDQMADVHESLWVSAVTFVGSRANGPTTRLEMMRPKTFQVFATYREP